MPPLFLVRRLVHHARVKLALRRGIRRLGRQLARKSRRRASTHGFALLDAIQAAGNGATKSPESIGLPLGTAMMQPLLRKTMKPPSPPAEPRSQNESDTGEVERMHIQGTQGEQGMLGEERAQIRELQAAVEQLRAAVQEQGQQATANAEDMRALRAGIDTLLKAQGLPSVVQVG